jgi:hypothetical protein
MCVSILFYRRDMGLFMNQTKKYFLRCFLASALAVYSNAVLADHGSIGFGIGTASPIITQTGITLPQGKIATGLITQFTGFDDISANRLIGISSGAATEARSDIHSTKTLTVPQVFAAIGVTDDLTLGTRFAYVRRDDVLSAHEHGEEFHDQGNPDGFGGVSFFGQYRIFHTEDDLNHLSVVVGLQTPTGATRQLDKSSGEVIEVHSQPSLSGGAWNPSAGLSFTRAMGKFSLDSSVLYTVATSGARSTNIGDFFEYNFALSYALAGDAKDALFVDSNRSQWTAILELNGIWQDHIHVHGMKDPNSGGNIVYISPGIRYSGGSNWNTALSVGTPILKDSNGFQTDPDYRITFRFVIVLDPFEGEQS